MTSPGPRRQSPAVYQRRRLLVGTLVVLLVLLLWWLISSTIGWVSDEDEPDPAATSEPTAQAEVEGSEDDDGTGDEQDGAESEESGQNEEESEQDRPEGACAPGDLEVTASTGEDAYAPNEAPLLIMEIEHTGDEGCELDAGTGEQEFSVSRQGREIFTAAQCQEGNSGESYELDMEPGQTERAQLDWPRSDSSEDCTEPADLAPGTYELVVSLGGITSDPHEFTLQEE